jgi:hypothetical protein
MNSIGRSSPVLRRTTSCTTALRFPGPCASRPPHCSAGRRHAGTMGACNFPATGSESGRRFSRQSIQEVPGLLKRRSLSAAFPTLVVGIPASSPGAPAASGHHTSSTIPSKKRSLGNTRWAVRFAHSVCGVDTPHWQSRAGRAGLTHSCGLGREPQALREQPGAETQTRRHRPEALCWRLG